MQLSNGGFPQSSETERLDGEQLSESIDIASPQKYHIVLSLSTRQTGFPPLIVRLLMVIDGSLWMEEPEKGMIAGLKSYPTEPVSP